MAPKTSSFDSNCLVTQTSFSFCISALSCLLLSCSDSGDAGGGASFGSSKAEAASASAGTEGVEPSSNGDGDEEEQNSESGKASAGSSQGGESSTPGDGSKEDPDGGNDGAIFDVETLDPDEAECASAGEGVHCRDLHTSFECDADSKPVSVTPCQPDICVEDLGCVLCKEGQIGCKGNQVLKCDTSVPGHQWELLEECDPEKDQVCDYKTGTCVQDEIIGTTDPTGVYHLFSTFHYSDGFPELNKAFDIGSFERRWKVEGKLSFENRIYLPKTGGAKKISVNVFEVKLLDSDGDGHLEPNQHPESATNPGPIEERQLIHLDTLQVEGEELSRNDAAGEFYATEDYLYYVGHYGARARIIEIELATGDARAVTTPRDYTQLPQIGFDPVHNIWYAGYSHQRRVWQYDSASESWGSAFSYPDLAGTHMDGMEVVQDPNSNEVYVYVSDMTTDYLGQYRLDIDEGWVQENVFAYQGPEKTLVEGMGYGALGHFWMSGSGQIIEVGGGDLEKYTEPVQ